VIEVALTATESADGETTINSEEQIVIEGLLLQ